MTRKEMLDKMRGAKEKPLESPVQPVGSGKVVSAPKEEKPKKKSTRKPKAKSETEVVIDEAKEKTPKTSTGTAIKEEG